MKYLMYRRKVGKTVQNVPIIFPNELVHSDIATALENAESLKGFKLRSAGQVSLGTTANLTTYGESSTLRLRPHENDEWVIGTNDYMHGLIEK